MIVFIQMWFSIGSGNGFSTIMNKAINWTIIDQSPPHICQYHNESKTLSLEMKLN